jgi:hypothetical protein
MHLVGPWLTTTSYRKNKTKLTKRKQEELQLEWQAHNRKLKSAGIRKLSFDEYLEWVFGNGKYQKQEFKPLVSQPRYIRTTPNYPSLMTMGGPDSCAKKEPQKYTGTLVKGIATMHKSNAVPVIDEEQMKEISRMRRG